MTGGKQPRFLFLAPACVRVKYRFPFVQRSHDTLDAVGAYPRRWVGQGDVVLGHNPFTALLRMLTVQ